MKLKIYGSVAILGALTMVTNVSANTVAQKLMVIMFWILT